MTSINTAGIRKLANPFVGLNKATLSYHKGAVDTSSCRTVVFPIRLICNSVFISKDTSVHAVSSAL